MIIYAVIFILLKIAGGQKNNESFSEDGFNYSTNIKKSFEELPRQLETIPVDENGFMTDVSFSEDDPRVSDFTYWAPGVDGKKRPASAYFVGFAPFSTDEVWVPLVTVSNRLKYKSDFRLQLFGFDVWQTSRYSYRRKAGDCEDHAILLADWLIQMGYDARVVIGTNYLDAHAWVVVFKDGKEYFIEATKKGVKPNIGFPNEKMYFTPTHMFNNDTSWMKGNWGLDQWKKRAKFI